jgi:hypothetical protein
MKKYRCIETKETTDFLCEKGIDYDMRDGYLYFDEDVLLKAVFEHLLGRKLDYAYKVADVEEGGDPFIVKMSDEQKRKCEVSHRRCEEEYEKLFDEIHFQNANIDELIHDTKSTNELLRRRRVFFFVGRRAAK